MQKSAEAVVVPMHRDEGPNIYSRCGTMRSRRARDADKRAEKLTPPCKADGGTVEGAGLGRQACPVHTEPATEPSAMHLMEQVVQRENLLAAYQRVQSNKGAPGVDGMTVDELADFCRQHWPRIREALLSGRYVPQPVRKVEIPKPDGKGVRMLGIPTVR
jgi:RNA-directed DNA polymerase